MVIKDSRSLLNQLVKGLKKAQVEFTQSLSLKNVKNLVKNRSFEEAQGIYFALDLLFFLKHLPESQKKDALLFLTSFLEEALLLEKTGASSFSLRKAAIESIDSIKKAIENQSFFIRSTEERKNLLQEKKALLPNVFFEALLTLDEASATFLHVHSYEDVLVRHTSGIFFPFGVTTSFPRAEKNDKGLFLSKPFLCISKKKTLTMPLLLEIKKQAPLQNAPLILIANKIEKDCLATISFEENRFPGSIFFIESSFEALDQISRLKPFSFPLKDVLIRPLETAIITKKSAAFLTDIKDKLTIFSPPPNHPELIYQLTSSINLLKEAEKGTISSQNMFEKMGEKVDEALCKKALLAAEKKRFFSEKALFCSSFVKKSLSASLKMAEKILSLGASISKKRSA